MFEKILSSVKDFFLRPVEQKGLRAVLFGKDTLTICCVLFIGGIILGLLLLVLQLCSVAIDTREGIVGFGVVVMLFTCIYLLVPAVKALDAIWKKVVYLLLMPMLFSLVITLSQWVIFLVIGGIICYVLFKGFFGSAGGVSVGGFGGGGSSGGQSESDSSNYGKFYSGITGDYIQGEHGDDQRITMNLGGGDVQTEKGERYHVDESGHATKL